MMKVIRNDKRPIWQQLQEWDKTRNTVVTPLLTKSLDCSRQIRR